MKNTSGMLIFNEEKKIFINSGKPLLLHQPKAHKYFSTINSHPKSIMFEKNYDMRPKASVEKTSHGRQSYFPDTKLSNARIALSLILKSYILLLICFIVKNIFSMMAILQSFIKVS